MRCQQQGSTPNAAVGMSETAIELDGIIVTTTTAVPNAIIVNILTETTSKLFEGQTYILDVQTMDTKCLNHVGDFDEGSACYFATTIDTIIQGPQCFLIVSSKPEEIILGGSTTNFTSGSL